MRCTLYRPVYPARGTHSFLRRCHANPVRIVLPARSHFTCLSPFAFCARCGCPLFVPTARIYGHTTRDLSSGTRGGGDLTPAPVVCPRQMMRPSTFTAPLLVLHHCFTGRLSYLALGELEEMWQNM